MSGTTNHAGAERRGLTLSVKPSGLAVVVAVAVSALVGLAAGVLGGRLGAPQGDPLYREQIIALQDAVEKLGKSITALTTAKNPQPDRLKIIEAKARELARTCAEFEKKHRRPRDDGPGEMPDLQELLRKVDDLTTAIIPASG